MKISGILTIKDNVYLGYPFLEAILSILPISDEFLVNDGGSGDGTLEYLKRLQKTFPKIVIYQTPWLKGEYWEAIDETLNYLIKKAKGDWLFEAQGDEIWHEKDLIPLRKIIKSAHKGDYNSIRHRRLDCTFVSIDSYVCKRVRIVRNLPGLKSYLGGDDFHIGKQGNPRAGYTTHNVPPELEIEIPWYHFSRLFPKNTLRADERIALEIAPKDESRIVRWEEQKKVSWDLIKPPPPEQILDCLPALIKGLNQESEYKVREELFDKKWLSKITGLKYL